jgi:hypothetical protein
LTAETTVGFPSVALQTSLSLQRSLNRLKVLVKPQDREYQRAGRISEECWKSDHYGKPDESVSCKKRPLAALARFDSSHES